jgi:hypothetical protein
MQRTHFQERGFFELTWSIFRFCMKSIFTVFTVVGIFCMILVCFCSPEMNSLPPHQFLASLASALLFGVVFISYATLFLAVPVSIFCASLAFLVTGLIKITEIVLPNSKPAGFGWPGFSSEPPPPDPRVQVIETRIDTDAGLCPVCAASLDAEAVRCVRCESPHHRECWDYVGSCATFGCGGDQRVEPGEKKIYC